MSSFRIPGGYTLLWTCLTVQKHDGSPHNGVGVLPTVPAHRTLRGIREGRDEVLETALEMLTTPSPRG